jgi:hypothetical protein
MFRKISLITALVGAALVLGVPAAWGQSEPVGLSSDAFERAALATQRSGVTPYLDAHGRAVTGDTRAVSTFPKYADAFERAALSGSNVVPTDSHDRVVPTPAPGTSPVATGRDIEWPQIGIGVGLGIVLALLLGIAMRHTRMRPLAS